MEVKDIISAYIFNKYINDPDERLLTVKFRKAGIGFAVDFVAMDHSGFLYNKSTWISCDDLGGFK